MYIYIIMIVQSSDKFNKGQFAKCNDNTSILDICKTPATIKLRTTSPTRNITKCSAQTTAKVLPKELLSTVTLTTHLLPKTVAAFSASTNLFRESTNFSKTCSYDSENIKNRTNQTFNKCCSCKNLSTYGNGPIGSNGKIKQEPLQFLPQTTCSPLMTATTKIESIYSTYKFRHRRYTNSKTVANNNINNKSVVDNTLNKKQNMMATSTESNRLLIVTANNKKNEIVSTKRLKKKTSPSPIKSFRFRPLSGLKVTSLFSLLTLVCLETVLLSTVSNCAKTFYMHWNTSNSIFRIDNTDHIIDVNKGNLAFEFDQVHIICPVYEPGTFENETEKYIIYNVSKVEYETCRITNADPRVIAVCDKPQKLMFFTITFRPFTPQPGGLEFLPGNDYYFISTSSKDDLYRRIGGRCSTNNMKVVFKVCCASEDKNNKTSSGGNSGGRNSANTSGIGGGSGISTGIVDSINANGSGGLNIAAGGTVNQHINSISTGLVPGSNNINNGVQLKPSIGGLGGNSVGTSGTSINTNIDQFNRIPIQTNGIGGISNGIGGIGLGSHGSSGILLTPGGSHGMLPGTGSGGGVNINGQYPNQQTGIRINNVPSQQHPSHKNNNDDLYNKHPNEVVKNEELTYNSAGTTLHHRCRWKFSSDLFKSAFIDTIYASITTTFNGIDIYKTNNLFINKKFTIVDILLLKLRNLFCFNINPIIIITILVVTFSTNIFLFRLHTSSSSCITSTCKVSLRKSKSSYLPIISSNYSTSFRSGNEKCTNKISNTTIRSKISNVNSNKHNFKNAYQNHR